ncbi:MAG: glycosyltransferase family 4 protein [Rhodanobacteraceae bacterium]|nr:MAG: glycosyltransferase family 4 protein [Rhodanobacteraceae bacterium]
MTAVTGKIENARLIRPSSGAARRPLPVGEDGLEHKIRLLVFTSLYPNAERPRHGVFVEERLRHLVDSGRIAATVVAPVPWFPLKHRRFGEYAACARVPAREERYGITVLHPRYPVIPKLGMSVAPSLMYHALRPVLQKLLTSGEHFDLIDAHYFYPDGVAATRLGEALGKPVVITARGSDLTLLSRYRWPKQQVREAAEQAAAIVTVAQALKDEAVVLGMESGKITVLRNGVDLERFRPLDRAAIRAKLNLKDDAWLAVGNLVELKGVHITLAALAKAPDVTLLIAGDGPEEDTLRRLADRLGITGRVRFLGAIAHDKLCDYYNAADAMVLASSREGMPNVVLESLACGTPVVATRVHGTPEVIAAPEAGELMDERGPEALLRAWEALRARAPDHAATRQFAERFGWAPVVDAQCALYARVLADCRERAMAGAQA